MECGAEISNKIKMNSNCPICGEKLRLEEAELNYILPIELGGTNSADNLRYICKACSEKKGNKRELLFEYYARLMSKSNSLTQKEAMKIDYVIRNMTEADTEVLIEKISREDSSFNRLMAYYKALQKISHKDIKPDNQELRDNMQKSIQSIGDYDFLNEERVKINGNTFKYKSEFPIEDYREILGEYGEEKQEEIYSVYLDDSGRLVVY